LEITARNAERNRLSGRVTCKSANVLNPPTGDFEGERFDVILCNPPYIAADEMPALDSSVLREPRIALTDEADGLTFYKAVLENWAEMLKPGGTLIFECAAAQAQKIALLQRTANVSNTVENVQIMSNNVEKSQINLRIIPTGELQIQ